ncbi:MAG: hypothetical protein IJ760_06160 [Bacteroidales bacterium]|nr:hypothetical protein [Bacteroidales bacterium]
MNNVAIKPIVRRTALDAMLVTLACLVPAASHMLGLPLYKANPMLALLLAGVLLGRDWRNALLLAVAMPLASGLLVGMPAGPKMICMMAELATVAGLFTLASRRLKALPAVLLAIAAGKAVYYALKALLLAPAMLVGTDWKLQLLAALLWGGLFALLFAKRK